MDFKKELPIEIGHFIFFGIDARLEALEKALVRSKDPEYPQDLKLTRDEIIREVEVLNKGIKFGEKNGLFIAKHLKIRLNSIELPEEVSNQQDDIFATA